jgi:hypothetical protein
MDDLISREDAIDAIYEHEFANWCDKDEVSTVLNDLPSAQPEICCDAEPRLHITGYIPEAWIENEIEWLRGLGSPFASLTAMNIETMLKKWREQQESEEGKHDAIREGAERGVPADAHGLGETHDRDAKEAN